MDKTSWIASAHFSLSLIFYFYKSYLTDRTQRTKFNDTLSDLNITECGVPQGSILGPLLS